MKKTPRSNGVELIRQMNRSPTYYPFMNLFVKGKGLHQTNK